MLHCFVVDIKPCPRCSAFITKLDDGSCNHMTCTMCAAEFCWLCMKEISDLHYLRLVHDLHLGKIPETIRRTACVLIDIHEYLNTVNAHYNEYKYKYFSLTIISVKPKIVQL